MLEEEIQDGGMTDTEKQSGNSRPAGKEKSKTIKVVSVIIAIIAILGAAATIAYNAYLGDIQKNLAGNVEQAAEIEEALSKVEMAEKDTSIFDEPFYALVLGSDQRDDEVSRSDVMMLVRCDAKEGTVSIVSLPRDIMVDLDDYGTNKINAAYAYGGAKLSIATVEDLSGISINHYVEVHFDELEQVIDELGGLNVDIPVANNETGVQSSETDFAEGVSHLTGAETLEFVRERYGYNRGDFQRADNQRLVAMAIIKAVLDRPAYELPSTLSKISKTITTDLSIEELMALSSMVKKNEDLTFYSAIAPCTSDYIDGGWYDILDEDAFADMIKAMDKGKDISKEESGESAGSTARGETIEMDGTGEGKAE